MKLFDCIKNFILCRKFNLVNSPFQFLCFIEYINSRKEFLRENHILYVAYCSDFSKNQIKNINKNIYAANLKIFYLDEIFNLKIFHIFFFILKKIKRKFLFCICGTYNYYLFKEFVKNSHKSILLDEGIDLLSIKNNEDFKKYKPTFFSCFPIKNENFQTLRNDFSYMKKYKNKNTKIDDNLFYCLGTTFFENKIRSSGLKKHLNDLRDQYKDKKIYYFSHRNEKVDNNFFENFHIKHIDIPIELFLLQSKVLPKNICGFYSTALYTLKKIFLEEDINIVNINFDFKLYNWEDYKDFDKIIFFDNLLKNSGVKNFYK